MSLIITRNAFNSEFYPTAPDELDYLLGNIWEKQTRVIEFESETIMFAVSGNTVDYGPAGYTNNAEICRNLAQGYEEFNIGDTFTVLDAVIPANNGSYTVVDKINDGTLRVSPAFPSSGSSGAAAHTLTTEYEGIQYFYNLIGNSEALTYNSKINNAEQKLTFDAYGFASTAVETMLFNGGKAYQIGTVTVERTTASSNDFKITHEFYIIPVILPGEWVNFIGGTPPPWFAQQEALKMVNKLIVSKDLNDPIRQQFGEILPPSGNVGWKSENFNTGINNYSVSLVEYYDNIPNTLIPEGFKLTTDEIRVEITLDNVNNSPFVDLSTEFTLNFQIAPTLASDINDNDNFIENFLFDRNASLQTVGSAPVAGMNFGGTEQVFKEISASFVNSTQIIITGVIAMSSDNVTKIESMFDKRFILGVVTQDGTLAVEQSDRETIIADANDFFIDNATPSLLNYNTVLIEHPFEDFADGLATVDTFKEDEILVKSRFNLDETEKQVPTDNIFINEIRTKVILKNISGDVQELETFDKVLSGSIIVNQVPEFDETTPRNFVIPSTEVRKDIRLRRRNDLDAGTLKFYEIIYPFRVRFEAFKQLTGVNIINSFTNDFYDSSLEFNGVNNNWFRYANHSDWGIFVRLEVDIQTGDGGPQTFTEDTEFTISDYLANPDWDNEITRYFDASSNLLPANIVLLNQDTKIQADFEFIGATPPTLADLDGVLYIGRDEIDDIFSQRSLSTVYDRESVSWFKSQIGNGLVKISNPSGNIWRLEADIDSTKIPDDAPLCITARIYDKRIGAVVPPDAKLLEDGQPKLLEDGQFKLLD